MKAILFPGQGSQVVGMGSEFYNNFPRVKKIFEEADDILNFKISKIILEGPEEDLKLTQNTQPAILVVSYSIFTVLKSEYNYKFNSVNFFAGHSLGEYSALLCSNALTFKDSLYLLFQRGKFMQEAVPAGKGAMLAVLGSDIIDINKLILKLKKKGVCEIANDNARGQTIVSGDINLIEELKNELKKIKKKSIMLPVSAPFHCSLMKSAANKMIKIIDSINFKKPDFKIVTNVTADSITDETKFKELLIEQIYTKVRWRESIDYMIKNSVDEFIEIGPGKVLSGLIKRIAPNINSFSINSINDIENIIK
ncbi:MAG: [acyl-carrier-protein] S-malonyltransferase [Pelagibacterales bacterium]|nr:[acyl-carrier-protein] S-malonyltransferase [Pelagibacterales bacterium]